MPRKIGRVVAARRGLSRYFTGEPCARGHLAERYVLSGTCLECNRLGSAARMAEHRAELKRLIELGRG
jgi:hypothetical protein